MISPAINVTGNSSADFFADTNGSGSNLIGGKGVIIYVNANATAGGDGTSWGNAYREIPENLRAGTKVFIAEGTYYAGSSTKDAENETDARANSIKLNEGVEYYGGFRGDETHLSQRDPSAHKTVLSGEWGDAGFAGNSYAVVKGAKDAVLDGFQVTGGNAIPGRDAQSDGGASGAVGSPPSGSNGGAPGGQPVHLTPEMILKDAADGRVDGAGGGISITDGMTVRNTEVSNNRAIKGGGIYVMTAKEGTFPARPGETQTSSKVTLDNVDIHDNEAMARGGGIEAELGSSIELTNSDLNANKSDKGGGLYLDFMSKALIVNTTVKDNQANSAGGLGADGGSSLGLRSSTVTGNSAKDEGGGIYLGTGQQNHAVVIKSIVNSNKSGGSGQDTFTWHGNDVSVRSSLIGQGDVTSSLAGGDANNIGATEKNLSRRATEKLLGKLDRAMPKDAMPSMAALGAPPSATNSGNTTAPVKSSDRIVMVNASATGKGTGTSWADAYTDLNAALKDAAKDGARVFIAAGTYKPTGEGRESTFKIPDGVRVYGGFAGTESSVEQRVAGNSATILDGDIGKNGDASDNAYHVVKGGNNITLDGLTVKNGNANGVGYNGHGGGMVNYENTPQANPDNEHGFTNIKLSGVTFDANQAKEGGAMYNYGQSDIEITRSLFVGNSAQNGGAIVDRVGVHTNLNDVNFSNNSATYNGGAYYADYGSRVNASGVNAQQNSADTDGGFYYGVSRASQLEETVAQFSNSTISGNKAQRSGAAFAVNDMSKLYLVGNTLSAQNDPSVSVTGNSTATNGSAPSDTFVRKTTSAPGGSPRQNLPPGHSVSPNEPWVTPSGGLPLRQSSPTYPQQDRTRAGASEGDRTVLAPSSPLAGSVFMEALDKAFADGSLSANDTTFLVRLLGALYANNQPRNTQSQAL
jgi:predicted outer membrane repeat protein